MTLDNPINHLKQRVLELENTLRQHKEDIEKLERELETKLCQQKCTQAEIDDFNNLIRLAEEEKRK